MTVYNAPLNEIKFLMKDVLGIEEIASLNGYEDATEETIDAILEEAAKLGRDIIAPLGRTSDTQGAVWNDQKVTTSPGFKEAYEQFVEGGWQGLGCDPEFGGMGLPFLLSNAVNEIWNSSSIAFGLCPMLTGGAIEAIETHGSDEQKEKYLPKMISGEWTGTMNLTEPSAGSDLAAISTKAVPQEDGTYKISGQKIFITFGEHDLTENIIHLVLARTPDAPAGSRGISLFIVPKFMVNEDGSLGDRNSAYCISIEHKLGIHGSPTATMSFENATGYLVREENKGLACMFTMMNNARLNVGNEGFAAGERAYQAALAYAQDRIQSPLIGSKDKTSVSIDKHPDVRRMLLTMKAKVQAARAISYFAAYQQDFFAKSNDEARKIEADALIQLLTPVVKAFSTDIGIEVANEGIQVHGGMGFIEESGAAQWLRDVRITAIYEGTNGIQANDLIGRKVAMNDGAYVDVLMSYIAQDLDKIKTFDENAYHLLRATIEDVKAATNWLIAAFKDDAKAPACGSVHYLRMMGYLCGGWLLLKSAYIAKEKLETGQGDPVFMQSKINIARVFAAQFLSTTPSLKTLFTDGHEDILACGDEWLQSL